MKLAPFALFTALVAATTPLAAQDAQDTQAPTSGGNDRELGFEKGRVDVSNGLATIDLPEGWSYLQRADARFVVEELWGNPPDASVVGLVSPDAEDANWAIIVSVENDGHVDDSDVNDLDYDDLLESMQDDSKESNEARKEAGYETVELVGWAEAPHYDAAEKKLYWAKQLRFEGSPTDTLNYDVRVLGRDEVLVLSAVGDMSDLAAVAAGSKEILAVTEFTEGNRYTDFDPTLDKVAAYGIGGLIAGKVLAKAGLFAVLAKFAKVIVIGVVAVFAGAVKLLRGKRSEPEVEPVAPKS
jgi:uncharacterized membrane-anchored protein